MKPRLLPIILILLGAAGMVLFFLTPVMTARFKVVDTSTDTDFTFSLNVNYDGGGSLKIDGTELGVDVTTELEIEPGDWVYTDAEAFPAYSIYLNAIGIGVAILGMLFSIFGGNSTLRILGALLGILGAASCITGCFLMWNFYSAFKADGDDLLELAELGYGTYMKGAYSNFYFGWLAPVISMGLIALSSFFFLAVKPKGAY